MHGFRRYINPAGVLARSESERQNARTEDAVVADELLGWLNLGAELAETSESIWRRVALGHLRRGSVGYDYALNDFVTIPAGETRSVAGRKVHRAAKPRTPRRHSLALT